MNSLEELLEYVKVSLKEIESSEKKISRIIEAMKIIDRKFFVKNKKTAYHDFAIPINNNQTISQPSTVARMLSILNPEKGEDILEIGSGSGWNASIIGYLCYPGKIKSLEVIEELAKKSEKNLEELKQNISQDYRKRLNKISFERKNIFREEINENFDKIIITAGIKKRQEKYIEELASNYLKDNGKLICPYQKGPILIIKKRGNTLSKEYSNEYYLFVPLIINE